jgi:bacteriorhodopsin
VYQLAWEARIHASSLGGDIGRTYLMCGALTTVLWTLYPIAWGVCEGGNVIAPDSEAAFYGVLDVLAKPVFGALLLWGHRNIDPARLGLAIRDYADDPAVHGGLKGEKVGHNNGTAPAVGNGAGTTTTAAPTAAESSV